MLLNKLFLHDLGIAQKPFRGAFPSSPFFADLSFGERVGGELLASIAVEDSLALDTHAHLFEVEDAGREPEATELLQSLDRGDATALVEVVVDTD